MIAVAGSLIPAGASCFFNTKNGKVLCAATRPGRLASSTTQSPRRTASRTLWVTKITVLPVARPQRFELVVQAVAGHRVERAERLVHQQHVGVLGERAGERDALAHAARELVRPLLGEVAEVHHLEQLVGARAALVARRRRRASARARRCRARSATGTARPPGTSARCGSARTSTAPDVGWSRPATRLSSVLLPQPDAPSRQTNSPGATSRVTPSSATTALAARCRTTFDDVGDGDDRTRSASGRSGHRARGEQRVVVRRGFTA